MIVSTSNESEKSKNNELFVLNIGDLVEIQHSSYYSFLHKGFIEVWSKKNELLYELFPSKELFNFDIFFLPKYYHFSDEFCTFRELLQFKNTVPSIIEEYLLFENLMFENTIKCLSFQEKLRDLYFLMLKKLGPMIWTVLDEEDEKNDEKEEVEEELELVSISSLPSINSSESKEVKTKKRNRKPKKATKTEKKKILKFAEEIDIIKIENGLCNIFRRLTMPSLAKDFQEIQFIDRQESCIAGYTCQIPNSAWANLVNNEDTFLDFPDIDSETCVRFGETYTFGFNFYRTYYSTDEFDVPDEYDLFLLESVDSYAFLTKFLEEKENLIQNILIKSEPYEELTTSEQITLLNYLNSFPAIRLLEKKAFLRNVAKKSQDRNYLQIQKYALNQYVWNFSKRKIENPNIFQISGLEILDEAEQIIFDLSFKFLEHWGDIPLMTKEGTFIINGCERVVVNQTIRSPGVIFQKIDTGEKKYKATLISDAFKRYDFEFVNTFDILFSEFAELIFTSEKKIVYDKYDLDLVKSDLNDYRKIKFKLYNSSEERLEKILNQKILNEVSKLKEEVKKKIKNSKKELYKILHIEEKLKKEVDNDQLEEITEFLSRYLEKEVTQMYEQLRIFFQILDEEEDFRFNRFIFQELLLEEAPSEVLLKHISDNFYLDNFHLPSEEFILVMKDENEDQQIFSNNTNALLQELEITEYAKNNFQTHEKLDNLLWEKKEKKLEDLKTLPKRKGMIVPSLNDEEDFKIEEVELEDKLRLEDEIFEALETALLAEQSEETDSKPIPTLLTFLKYTKNLEFNESSLESEIYEMKCLFLNALDKPTNPLKEVYLLDKFEEFKRNEVINLQRDYWEYQSRLEDYFCVFLRLLEDNYFFLEQVGKTLKMAIDLALIPRYSIEMSSSLQISFSQLLYLLGISSTEFFAGLDLPSIFLWSPEKILCYCEELFFKEFQYLRKKQNDNEKELENKLKVFQKVSKVDKLLMKVAISLKKKKSRQFVHYTWDESEWYYIESIIVLWKTLLFYLEETGHLEETRLLSEENNEKEEEDDEKEEEDDEKEEEDDDFFEIFEDSSDEELNRFSIGEIGRYRLNKKFFLTFPLTSKYLTVQDLIGIFNGLYQVEIGENYPDDIDDLKNKLIRGVGEQLLETILKRRRSTNLDEKLNRKQIDEAKSLDLFFIQSPLSQYFDQLNPLSEVTHKRRVSVFGDQGIERGGATTSKMRDIHSSYYGKFCPIETPEGESAGLVTTLALFAKRSSLGIMEAPYYYAQDRKLYTQHTPIFLDAYNDSLYTFLFSNYTLEKKKPFFPDEYFVAKEKENFTPVFSSEIDFAVLHSSQILSLATSLVPFIEHNDGNRALMGANMQRQALPLILPTLPIVGTGFETSSSLSSNSVIRSYTEGVVTMAASTLIEIKDKKNQILSYILRKYKRSNQATSLNQTPCIWIGEYIFRGQVIVDSPSTINGELSLGSNLTVAYMPWQGYNYEDAIIINENLVFNDILTSLHIESFEDIYDPDVDIFTSSPDILLSCPSEAFYLTSEGIIRIGSYVRSGDILIGKTTISPSDVSVVENFLSLLRPDSVKHQESLEKKYQNKSLIVPESIEGRVIDISFNSKAEEPSLLFFPKKKFKKFKHLLKHLSTYPQLFYDFLECDFPSNELFSNLLESIQDLSESPIEGSDPDVSDLFFLNPPKRKAKPKKKKHQKIFLPERRVCDILTGEFFETDQSYFFPYSLESDEIVLISQLFYGYSLTSKVTIVHSRKIEVGDKLSGRHGNKGIISRILPLSDMPFLPTGQPVDILLNPLGVPSRMNVGQLLEALLGFAGEKLGKRFKVGSFDEVYGIEASRSFVTLKLKEAAFKTNQKWLFTPEYVGKIFLRDGQTGEYFDNPTTIGKAYILKLCHVVHEKIHTRSKGPYNAITQQPLAGKANNGGQRFGEMEVWALEAHGCSYTLQELISIRSDDLDGRTDVLAAMMDEWQEKTVTQALKNRENQEEKSIQVNFPYIPSEYPHPSLPQAYLGLVRELNALGLDFTFNQISEQSKGFNLEEEDIFTQLERKLRLKYIIEKYESELFFDLEDQKKADKEAKKKQEAKEKREAKKKQKAEKKQKALEKRKAKNEKKKAEREAKKAEKQIKKAENEAKKAQKEAKKAEREKKKAEKEVKKKATSVEKEN